MTTHTIKRICLVVNPHGGRRIGPSVLRRVGPIFEAEDIELDIIETEYAGHAREVIHTHDLQDVDAFCAVGGDGTMHEVINGLLSRSDEVTLPLGLIPAGTGNSFLYGFDCLDPLEAARRIVAGKTRPIDVAQVILGDRVLYAFNIIGWGMVTDILIRSEQLRWLGENRYTVASALEVLRGRRRAARIIVDGEESIDEFVFVLACNTQYTGKGMRMAPYADLTDGLIDLVVVREATRRQMLRLLPKIFDGGHVHSPLVEYVQAKEFSLIPDIDETVNVDGELLDRSPLHVQMMPQAVQVLV
ncbi:MAG: diacylglycerol kinase family lipid kinase [Fidelibacterota bacterium]|nr:MAG: diacylglycerol kinase family lipid kinase [Candidatus Neomarinimicrobiota bacterium]